MKSHRKVWVLVAAMILSVTTIRAQDQRQDQQPDPRSENPSTPLPPIDSGTSGGNSGTVGAARGVSSGQPAQDDTTQPEPDTHTLGGSELLGTGTPQHTHNTFDPSLSITASGQTGLIDPAGQQITSPGEIIGGQLNFNRIWSRYHFTALYNGGANIYQNSAENNTTFQDAVISEEIQWERWRLILRDDFLASPFASFGGGGMGGPGLAGQFSSMQGTELNNIGQGFIPTDSVGTGPVMRYRNMVLGEADYSASRRSAFSFSGSYGLLHFSDSSFISSQSANFQLGYDYLLTVKDSIALIEGYGQIEYVGTTNSTENYMAAFAYGRKITGRLAFQAAVGPEEIKAWRAGQSPFAIITWTANSALTYSLRRTTYSAFFVRGLANGSGVFFGTVADTVSGSVSHRFTRYWSSSAHAGYSFNETIVQNGRSGADFNTWFVGANLGRLVGDHARLDFNYGILQQDNVSCPVTICSTNGVQQTFGLTLNWHLLRTGAN